MEITEPLILSCGYHEQESNRGCAMEVLSWVMGYTEKTDTPGCTARELSSLVQHFNDVVAVEWGIYPMHNRANVGTTRYQQSIELQPEHAAMAFDLAYATVGTGARRGLLSDAERELWINMSGKYVEISRLIDKGKIRLAYEHVLRQITVFKALFILPLSAPGVTRIPSGAEVNAALRQLADARG